METFIFMMKIARSQGCHLNLSRNFQKASKPLWKFLFPSQIFSIPFFLSCMLSGKSQTVTCGLLYKFSFVIYILDKNSSLNVHVYVYAYIYDTHMYVYMHIFMT